MEFVVSPTFCRKSGPISTRTYCLVPANGRARSTTRTDQLIDGSQGGPLSQGCVANAPTAGAGMQTRPLHGPREPLRELRARRRRSAQPTGV